MIGRVLYLYFFFFFSLSFFLFLWSDVLYTYTISSAKVAFEMETKSKRPKSSCVQCAKPIPSNCLSEQPTAGCVFLAGVCGSGIPLGSVIEH